MKLVVLTLVYGHITGKTEIELITIECYYCQIFSLGTAFFFLFQIMEENEIALVFLFSKA